MKLALGKSWNPKTTSVTHSTMPEPVRGFLLAARLGRHWVAVIDFMHIEFERTLKKQLLHVPLDSVSGFLSDCSSGKVSCHGRECYSSKAESTSQPEHTFRPWDVCNFKQINTAGKKTHSKFESRCPPPLRWNHILPAHAWSHSTGRDSTKTPQSHHVLVILIPRLVP